MTSNRKLLLAYFEKLGLKKEIADIYLSLLTHGPQTVYQLSKSTKIERTRIYRLLDDLKQSKVVEVQVHYKKELLRAAPLHNLQMLVNEKEQQAKALQAALPHIYTLMGEHEQHDLPTRVQYYKGSEGIKQMMWNETKAKSKVDAILYNNMQTKVGMTFFSSWVRKCNQKEIRFRGVISDEFMNDQQLWYAKHHNERLSYWEQRRIEPTIFPITYSTVIYDNVVNFYNWKRSDEVFGIEIYSQDIADAQRHIFELLWKSAEFAEDIET